jgi:hypothetical protein
MTDEPGGRLQNEFAHVNSKAQLLQEPYHVCCWKELIAKVCHYGNGEAVAEKPNKSEK